MKLSLFNHSLKVDGYFAVFNSYSFALSLLDEEEFQAFQHLIDHDPPFTEQMVENNFWVDDEKDEVEQIILDRIEFVEDSLKGEHKTYRIYTTTACNAKCPYCFEKGFKIQTLGGETTEDIIEYIKKDCPVEIPISFSWFGGEPMLNIEPITKICSELRESGYTFDSSMTTNGLLLTEDLIPVVKTIWNLDRVQITFDGKKDTHNLIKSYPGDVDGFDRTVKNMECLIKNQIRVKVRLNYDKNNFKEILELFRDFVEKYSGDYFEIYTSPVYVDSNQNNGQYLTEDEIDDYERQIFEMRKALGMEDDIDYLKRIPVPCFFACDPQAITIMPDGKILECPEVITEHSVIGTIYEGITKQEVRNSWLYPDIPEECRTCYLLPICQGGCIARNRGLSNTFHCYRYKGIMDDILENYVNSKINANLSSEHSS